MTDYDADQPVPPIRRSRRGGYSRTDKVLVTVGVALATGAAFFPWYVFLNPDEFSVPALWQGNTRDLPETGARKVMSVSPAAMVDNDNTAPESDLDPLATATTTAASAGSKLGAPVESGLNQPLPGATGFRLMHVANGRALIEDASGMYIVRVGSVLPDNSRLATFEQRDGVWVIVTSNGDVISRN